ncbi:hypothetical protein BN13_150014 [Nostocoides jenkinsii Ben 74]|uniref:Uncharacterized protein n=1 Tax=Nostocoides jenkinsii Ben 74 TaxID=1193518 RepID=A0A077MBU7_9MICO|nr:hypothetical protein BN13_150014 [Tetrasphaera jenkinsii Ben 74]
MAPSRVPRPPPGRRVWAWVWGLGFLALGWGSGSGDAVEDHGGGVGGGVADLYAARERLLGPLEAVGGVGEQGEDGLALADRVTGLAVDFHASPGLHRVLLAGPAGAEAPGGDAHGIRIHGGDETVALGEDLLVVLGDGHRRFGVSALGPDHPVPGIERAAVLERGPHVLTALARGLEHLLRQTHGQFHDIGRTAARKHLDGLAYLDGVAGGQPQWCRHIRQQRNGFDAGVGAEVDHRASELAGVVDVLHERPRADLDVENERPGALGDLLGHDRGGDQRDGLDGPRDIAQRIQLLIRRGQAGAGRADHRAHVVELGEHRLIGHPGLPTADRLQLVEGAAGVAEPATGQLRHGHPEHRDERGERQRDLVADTAGRVFVGSGVLERGKVHALARLDHRVGPRCDLATGHPIEQDSHVERRHLLLRDHTSRVGVDHPPDLLVRQLALVTLGNDDVDGIEGFAHGRILPAPGSKSIPSDRQAEGIALRQTI